MHDATIEISGKVIDKGSGINKVSVNQSMVSISTDGMFKATVSLSKGVNKIIIDAIDNAGNESSKTITIIYKKSRPKKTIIINLQIDNPFMVVNGVQQEIDPGRDTEPVIIPKWNRTVVPIRAIVEALGGTIQWFSSTRSIVIDFNEKEVSMQIGNNTAIVNGTPKIIDPNNHDVKPIIINDRTMLPLRFVAESLGCKVGWDPDTRTITITYGG